MDQSDQIQTGYSKPQSESIGQESVTCFQVYTVFFLSFVYCLLYCVLVREATEIILMRRGLSVIDFSSNA